MTCNARKFVRVTKFLLAGVTVFCVSWIASVNEWQGGAAWRGGRGPGRGAGLPTIRTIVAYSEEKLAEMERPSPLTCNRLPAFPKLKHIKRTWSARDSAEGAWQAVAGTRVSLFAAYYDDRTAQHYVRILATFKGRNFSADESLFCQTRSSHPYDEAVEVVAAKPLEIWWREWDSTSTIVETPLLLSCPLTEPIHNPSVVSIVTQPCDDPTNGFPVDTSQRTYKYKRTFTICVKDMNFVSDISHDLIEWIETNRILGVDKIDIYIDSITKEMENVLSFYENKNYLRLFHVPIKNKSKRSLWQRRRDHILTYNDCLYRNIQQSEYIIPLDVDEILFPKTAQTLPELMNRLVDSGWDTTKHSAILVRNVFFFDYMQGIHSYKLQKTYSNRSKTYIKRDDVRIDFLDDVNEIELLDDTNSLKEENTLDVEEEELGAMYKKRCGEEMRVPKLARSVVRAAVVSPKGHYSKSLMLTRRVLTAFNHYPLASLGAAGLALWPAPLTHLQLNHYKASCNRTVMADCARYGRRARIDRAAMRLREDLVRALAQHAPCFSINNTST